MTRIVKVLLWGKGIGRLAWDNRRKNSYFTYNPQVVEKSIDVSPLVAPLKGINAMKPIWGENAKIYQKLPASLPIRCQTFGATGREQTYYELATDAGIHMLPSQLKEIEGLKHFLTARFDRLNGEKIHMQTLAAICPETDSYEKLLWVCRKLHAPETDCEEVFRRMVFNHLMNNTDDHNKNFSFTMNRKGEWRLSPAYDITYIIDVGGYMPNRDHCMYMRAKLSGVTKDDILTFARDNGIRRVEIIIKSVVESAYKFREVAEINGVRKEWIGRIETCLQQHLADWGYEQKGPCPTDCEEMQNIPLEQAFNGNIHLLATIGGIKRKYIIRKGTPLHTELIEQGLSNVTSEHLISLANQYFNT